MVFPHIERGEDVREVIRAVARVNPQIQTIRLVEYDPLLRVEVRLALTHPGRTSVQNAMAAAFHHNLYNRPTDLSSRYVLSRRFSTYLKKKSRHVAFGLCSRVVLFDGSFAHIPMLDFRCRKSSKSIGDIEFILRAVDEREGVIVETHRSYHYYGFRLLSMTEWPRFLGRCLHARNYIDERYIGHTLQDGYCVLRLTPAPGKPDTPHVLKIFQA